MNFDTWWTKEMDMVFTSTDAADDALEAARRAWDAAMMGVLKEVFKYGYATETHLNIVGYLDGLGIPKREYSLWNKPAVNHDNNKPTYCGGCGYTHKISEPCPQDWDKRN